MHEVWRGLPEVERAYSELKYCQRLHDNYSKQMATFKREHPVRAALGLDPKIYDHHSGVERPLGVWERVRSAPELQARADAQNARVTTAERQLPNIKQALKDREPQHKFDMQAKQHAREQERARSRTVRPQKRCAGAAFARLPILA